MREPALTFRNVVVDDRGCSLWGVRKAAALQVLDDLHAARVTARRRVMWTWTAALCAVPAIAALVDVDVAIGTGMFAAVATVILQSVSRSRIAERARRLDIARGFVALLAPELHRGKLHLTVELRHWDAAGKTVRTGKSPHGNTKVWTRDAWLDLRGTLADGSRVTLRLVDKRKTKKGAVQRQSCTLVVRVAPTALGYDVERLALAQATAQGGGRNVAMRLAQGRMELRTPMGMMVDAHVVRDQLEAILLSLAPLRRRRVA